MSGENIESLMDSNNHISDNFQELLSISQRIELSNAATEQASASLEAGIDMDTISREIPAPKPVHIESVHVPVVEERYEPQPIPVQKSPVLVPEPIPAPATPIADTKPVS